MDLNEFIKQINHQLPTVEEVILKSFTVGITYNEVQASAFRDSLLIEKDKDTKDFGHPIRDLVKNTNINMVGIGGLNFYDSLDGVKAGGLEEFASYNDFYRLNISESKAGIFETQDESDDYIEKVCPDCASFFQFLICYNSYHRAVVSNREIDRAGLISRIKTLIKTGVSENFVLQFIELKSL